MNAKVLDIRSLKLRAILFLFLTSVVTLSTTTTIAQTPLYQWDTPLVGVYYFGNFAHSANPEVPAANLHWWRGVKQFHERTGSGYLYWLNRTPDLRTAHLKPLIGYYNQDNVSVIQQHIDQASLGGIDYFNFYWYWSKSRGTANHIQALNAYKRAANKSKVKFMVSIYSHPWDEDLFIPDYQGHLVAAEIFALFNDPGYLRIGNRPVLTIGDAKGIKAGYVNDMQDFIAMLKQYARDRSLPEPIVLAGVGSVRETPTSNWSLISNRDGYQCLVPDVGPVLPHDADANYVVQPKPYDNMVNLAPAWLTNINSFAPLSPCVGQNFDERPRQDVMIANPNHVRYFTGQTADKFAKAMSNVRNWQKTKTNSINKLVNLYAWNEWHEGGVIEPNVADRFLNLEKVQWAFKTVPLRRYNAGTHRVTTATPVSGTLEGGWKIFTQNKVGQNRRALYECRSGSNRYFLSLDSKCEGTPVVGFLGYIASTAQAYPGGNNNLLPLYRCNNGSSHFVSSDSRCEGATTEGLLGYGFYASIAELQ